MGKCPHWEEQGGDTMRCLLHAGHGGEHFLIRAGRAAVRDIHQRPVPLPNTISREARFESALREIRRLAAVHSSHLAHEVYALADAALGAV